MRPANHCRSCPLCSAPALKEAAHSAQRMPKAGSSISASPCPRAAGPTPAKGQLSARPGHVDKQAETGDSEQPVKRADARPLQIMNVVQAIDPTRIAAFLSEGEGVPVQVDFHARRGTDASSIDQVDVT